MPDCHALDATLGTNDDGTWFSTCGCGHPTCTSGTYTEAADTLTAHRAHDTSHPADEGTDTTPTLGVHGRQTGSDTQPQS